MRESSKRSLKRERRAFSAEFKVEAVRLMRERRALGVSLAQIGRELDVRPDILRAWARQLEGRPGAAVGDVFPGNGQLPSAEGEVRRLQRENAVLRQEREFLKKAHGYYGVVRVLALTRKKSARVASAVPVDEDHSTVRGPGWKDG